MAGKESRYDIVLGGRVDGSFGNIQNSLLQVSRILGQISDGLIDFGKDSLKQYASYEDNMLDAQVALSTQYDSTVKLRDVMQELNEAALSWATNSRFTTDDISKAISEAAHAGWDFDQIMSAMPTSMNVAMAGSMDLSQALEYMIDITNASGIGFENLTDMADSWVYAANSSSTTVEEMGQAMQRMGATMQFVNGDMDQLTTMLAVLANNGTKGTTAGTLLRSTLMRLIAPTKAAAQAMDGLIFDADELEEIYGGIDEEKLSSTVSMLEEAGFSAYDANGDLKDFLTIFEELYAVTAGMTEEDRNNVLSTIFPLRSITGAKALLAAAAEDWYGLYDNITNDSDGYTEYAGKTMESGIGGKIRLMQAAFDALKTNIGSFIADDTSNIFTSITSVLTSINEMDEPTFAGFIGGLEALAVSGSGLMTVALALRGINMILGSGPVGKIALAGVAIASLANGISQYVDTLHDVQYHDNFGSIALEDSVVEDMISGYTTLFGSIKREIDGYNEAIEIAIQKYTQASETFSTDLYTAALSGAQLTEEDKEGFMNLGGDMYDSIMEGLNNRFSADEATLINLSGMSVDDIVSGDGIWSSMLSLMNQGYEYATTQAATLSQNLRDAMTSAFEDNTLTPEEAANIIGITDQMAELVSLSAGIARETTVERELYNVSRLGIDYVETAAGAIQEARDIMWGDELAAYSQMLATNRTFAQMFEGQEIAGGPVNINGVEYATYSPEWLTATETQIRGEMDSRRASLDLQANNDIMRLFRAALTGTGAELYYDLISQAADEYLETGKLFVPNKGSDMDYALTGTTADSYAARNAITNMVEFMGGIESIGNIASQFELSGDIASAESWRQLEAMYHIATFGSKYNGVLDTIGDAIEWTGFGGVYDDIVRKATGTSIRDDDFRGEYYANFDPMNINVGEGPELQPTADMTAVEEAIAAESDTPIVIDVDGDTTALEGRISAAANRTITVSVLGRGAPITSMFAEGGRATEASIFGEAGAEWAIPEQHTQRTAELLDAARRASGFSWGELLSRNGGLNSGSNNSSTLVYSPTIYANDSRDVASKLAEDKARLEAWYSERMMREKMEVFT